jgi:DNA-binding winged helix-turn-helix (wHTH) protein/Tol biopolymer transport system component
MSSDNPSRRVLIIRQPFAVGDCVVDLALNQVERGGQRIHIAPRCAAVLEVLVHHAGRAVSKDHLIAEVWRGETPGDDAVAQVMVELRRAFADNARLPRYIRTVPRVGYALVANVAELHDPDLPQPQPGAGAPPTPTAAAPGRWVAAVAAILVVLTGVLAWLVAPGPGGVHSEATEVRFAERFRERPQPKRLTAALGWQGQPSLSPGANALVYAQRHDDNGRHSLIVRPLVGGAAVTMRAAEDGDFTHPVWSPDGAVIAYRACYGEDDCAIEVAPFTGGPGRRLLDAPPGPAGAFDWTADGKGLLLSSAPGSGNPLGLLRLLDVESGAWWVLEDGREFAAFSHDPRMSPDGRFVAFRRSSAASASPEGAGSNSLMLLDFKQGMARELELPLSDIDSHSWTPDSEHLVLASRHRGDADLYLYALEAQRIEPLDIGRVRAPRVAAREPWVAFEMVSVRQQLIGMAWPDGALEIRELTPPSTASDGLGVFAAATGRVAFTSDRSGSNQLWVADHDGTQPFPVSSFVEGVIDEACWSDDESRLLVLRQRAEGTEMLEIGADSWLPRTALQPTMRLRDLTCSRDVGLGHALRRDGDGTWSLARLEFIDGEWRAQDMGLKAASLRRDAARDALYVLSGPRGELKRVGALQSDPVPEVIDFPYRDWVIHDGRVVVLVDASDGRGRLLEANAKGDLLFLADLPFELPRRLRLAAAIDGTLVMPRLLADDSDVAVVSLALPTRSPGTYFELECGAAAADVGGPRGEFACRSRYTPPDH